MQRISVNNMASVETESVVAVEKYIIEATVATGLNKSAIQEVPIEEDELIQSSNANFPLTSHPGQCKLLVKERKPVALQSYGSDGGDSCSRKGVSTQVPPKTVDVEVQTSSTGNIVHCQLYID